MEGRCLCAIMVVGVRAKDLSRSLRCGRRCFSGPRARFAELTAASPRWISARSCGARERSFMLPAPGRRANLSFAEVDLGSLLRKRSLRKIVRTRKGRQRLERAFRLPAVRPKVFLGPLRPVAELTSALLRWIPARSCARGPYETSFTRVEGRQGLV